MTQAEIIALAGLGATFLLHTSALFYWGGRVTQMLRDHERRISRMER